MMSVSIVDGVGDEVLITVCCGALLAVVAGIWSYKTTPSHAMQDADTMRTGPTYNNEFCPICLGNHQLAVETNCGHKFCGACIKNYIQLRTHRELSVFSGRLSCPICRQDVNILLLSFTVDEIASPDLAIERLDIETTVHGYNITFGYGHRTMWSYVRDCPVLVRHLMNNFFSYGGLVIMFRLRVIFCVLASVTYLFLPLDFIPETLFGIFGFFDDVVVMFLCAIYVSILYRRYILSRDVNSDT